MNWSTFFRNASIGTTITSNNELLLFKCQNCGSDVSDAFQLAFLTPPFLGGFSAEVCEISPHNGDFLSFLDELRMMVNFICKKRDATQKWRIFVIVRKANSVQTSCGNMLTEIDIIAHYFMRDFKVLSFLVIFKLRLHATIYRVRFVFWRIIMSAAP
jgi:hypothetical protein